MNVDIYSPFGIPNEHLFSEKYNVKLVIDPNVEYFNHFLIYDKKKYDKLILIHGCEPRLNNNLTKSIINNSKFFDKIYSYDSEVLRNCNNSEMFVFGSCWVITNKENEIIQNQKDYFNNFKLDDKKFKLSFIKSTNKWLPGHKLRDIVSPYLEKKYEYDILYPKQRIENKIKLFTDSMFHLSIENSQQENYFTEKIIDCFMSYTIPIYWGCPNIGNFFELNGMIIVNSIEEMIYELNNIKENDYYDKLESVKKNYQICVDKKYAFFFDRINELINKI